MNNKIAFKRREPLRSRETLHTEAKRTIKSLIITLSLMIAALGTIFLFTTNEGAQKGYVLQQEKLKNEHLKSENTSLKTKITKATAFSKIENSEKVSKMKEKEEKNYVTKEDISVY